MLKAAILGTGRYLPERVLTNDDLSKMVDTNDEWIVQRTGIRTRRIAADNEPTSELAYKAAKNALDKSGIKPEEIDYIIVATFTPDYPLPSAACLVQHKLGAKNAGAFDLAAACSGYIYATKVATGLVCLKEGSTALVIGAEKLSSVTDWKDRGSCVLFGDGAGALILRSFKK